MSQRGRGGGRGGRGDAPPARGGGQRGGGYGGDRGDRGGSGRGGERGGRGGPMRSGGGDRGGRGGFQAHMPFRGPPLRGDVYLRGDHIPQPDPEITKMEDALALVTRDQDFEGFPGRRGFGHVGKSIVLRTNYLQVQTAFEAGQPEGALYMYTLDFPFAVSATKGTGVGGTKAQKKEISRAKKRALVEKLLEHAVFAGKRIATDYANTIVSTEKLDLGNKPQWKVKVTSGQATTGDNVPDFVQEARRRNTTELAVAYYDSFALRHIIEYLRSTSAGAEFTGRTDVINLLNIIMCKQPNVNSRITAVGGNKFYASTGHPLMESQDLGGGLAALRGYYSSVRPAIGRLVVNLNVTSGAFYKPIALHALIADSGLDNRGLEGFSHFLKVEVKYIKTGQTVPFMIKDKTIVGFAQNPRFGNAKQVKFKYNDGKQERETTVFDYFQNTHGITLQRADPVLNVGTKADPQYLPVELCTVKPGQAYRRLLGGDQTSKMIEFAARPPNVNAMSITGTASAPGNGLKLFELDALSQPTKDFGFKVSTSMLIVPGKILPIPKIKYGQKDVTPAKGSWNLAGVRFTRPGRFTKWQAVIINMKRNALSEAHHDVLGQEELFKALEVSLGKTGMIMGQRLKTSTISVQVNDRNGTNRTLEQIFQQAKKQGVQMLFVVLAEADKWLYSRIKMYGDVHYGIQTINSVGSKLQKPGGQPMYFGNLALKFNTKSGGISHTQPHLLAQLGKNTMLMGIDVTHPSPGSSDGAPSIACAVASYDDNLFQWPGSIRQQQGREEMVQGLKEMVIERLELYRSKNKQLPSKIIIYRDGVSEGQYALVLQHELPHIQEAFKALYGAPATWPKIAILIVGKRHHTRFYPTTQEDADFNPQKGKGSWNPLPGTMVDRGIVGKRLGEFYLQAHQGLQGTARPAHYVIIKDDIKLEADQWYQFTHHLCYMFNRATKAVSICPPAYYADLLAERGRAYLYTTFAESNASDSGIFDQSHSEWRGGVHKDIKDSTWYV